MGGVRVGSSWPINSTRAHLLGCLREIRLGKDLLTFHANVNENGTSDSSNPDFSLAKSAFTTSELSNVRFGCHSNNVCTGSLCGNGTCVPGWNAFHCACRDGYYGDRCEFNPCTSPPCVDGTCTVRGSGFVCACSNNSAGVLCNETCTDSFCKNGGKCGISRGKLACTCESGWTGQHCDSAIPRGDDDDDDNLPLIIGLAVAGGVLLLLIIAVIFLCTRQTSSTFGTYSPSTEEKAGARVEMDTVLNVPPPEKLI
jgi:protein crumbs